MTILEAEQLEPRIEVPDGMEITSDAIYDLGALTLLAGNVLIAKLDPSVVMTYEKNTPQGTALFGIMFHLREQLQTNHQLTFSTVPGEPEKVGIWISLCEKDTKITR